MEWFYGSLSQLFVMYPSFMVELQTVSHLSVILYTKKTPTIMKNSCSCDEKLKVNVPHWYLA